MEGEVSSSVYYTAAMELRNNRRWGLNENIVFQIIKGVKTWDALPYIRRISRRNINVVPEYGEWKKTLLIWSVLDNKLQIFKQLYEHGADPFILDERGYNSIHYCVNLERIEFLDVLANGKTVEELVMKLKSINYIFIIICFIFRSEFLVHQMQMEVNLHSWLLFLDEREV